MVHRRYNSVGGGTNEQWHKAKWENSCSCVLEVYRSGSYLKGTDKWGWKVSNRVFWQKTGVWWVTGHHWKKRVEVRDVQRAYCMKKRDTWGRIFKNVSERSVFEKDYYYYYYLPVMFLNFVKSSFAVKLGICYGKESQKWVTSWWLDYIMIGLVDQGNWNTPSTFIL